MPFNFVYQVPISPSVSQDLILLSRPEAHNSQLGESLSHSEASLETELATGFLGRLEILSEELQIVLVNSRITLNRSEGSKITDG